MNPSGWETVAAVATCFAAIFAGVQIGRSIHNEKRSTTFEHLREIDKRLQAVWRINIRATMTEITTAYTSGAEGLSDEAATYMALLNTLNLFALEIDEGAVKTGIAEDYLRSLCRREIISVDVVETIRTGWDDPKIYSNLLGYLHHFQREASDDGHQIAEADAAGISEGQNAPEAETTAAATASSAESHGAAGAAGADRVEDFPAAAKAEDQLS